MMPVLAPGAGSVEFERVRGRTVVVRSAAASPLKLICPAGRDGASRLYSCSYGGGLVGGDRLSVDLRVGEGAVVLLSTQSSTKVFRSPRPSGQTLKASVAAGGALVVAPDPLVGFAGSSYVQEQEFDLSADASLVAVDWFTSGRSARGERWAFDRYASRIAVRREGSLIACDATVLDRAHGPLADRFGRFDALAVVFVFGPRLADDAARLVASARAGGAAARGRLLAAASPVREGAVLRFAAESVDALGAVLRERLAFLRPLLGEEPWARKW
jgi:urease accessory protein